MNIEELKEVLPFTQVIRVGFTDDGIDYKGSKIGGTYYWPEKKNRYEKEYQFLAQINLSELPKNKAFPKKGILQFFIKKSDTYGLFSENSHKVVFHGNIDDGYELGDKEPVLPVLKTGRMIFHEDVESMSYSDYRFERYLNDEELIEEYYDMLSGTGSKILGYPFFTQWDPRTKGFETLLLQLDSDDEYIMWGDYGVGNFFIETRDLKNKNFSNTLFTWDCC